MYALQRTQCNTRNQLPQMRLPEPPPQEQGEESVIWFLPFRQGQDQIIVLPCLFLFYKILSEKHYAE
jgi:hypothetical protein